MISVLPPVDSESRDDDVEHGDRDDALVGEPGERLLRPEHPVTRRMVMPPVSTTSVSRSLDQHAEDPDDHRG